MTTFTCDVCLKIYQSIVIQGKTIYMLRNRRVMLLSNEQPCEDCIKKIEQGVLKTKKQIQEETIQQ